MTSWLSCDQADADPVRFWAGFIEAPRAIEPGFGADAAELLAIDRQVSADITASVANDAARLPAGSAVIVEDFHYAAAATAPEMTDLVERDRPGSIDSARCSAGTPMPDRPDRRLIRRRSPA